MPIQKTTPKEIVITSMQVFREKGYYRTSMKDLQEATGLTKGAFYHHFKNKEELMREGLRMTASWFDKRVFSIAYDESLSVKKRMKKMSDAAFLAYTSTKGGCIFANTILETAHVEDSFLPQVKGFFNSWEEAFSFLFKDSIPTRIRKKEVQKMVAEIEGAIIYMQLHQKQSFLKDAFQRIADRVK